MEKTDPQPTVAEALEAVQLSLKIADEDVAAARSVSNFGHLTIAAHLRAALPVLEAALAQSQRVRKFLQMHGDHLLQSRKVPRRDIRALRCLKCEERCEV